MHQAVGDGYAAFAVNGGKAALPTWYHNLRARPRAAIEVGPATIDVSARVAGEWGRAGIWERQK
jgi:F420H(2)-dependent quinone reductase